MNSTNNMDFTEIYKEYTGEEGAKDAKYQISLSLKQVQNILTTCKSLLKDEKGYEQIFKYVIIMRQFFSGQIYRLQVAQLDTNGKNISTIKEMDFDPGMNFISANDDLKQIEYNCIQLKEEDKKDTNAINMLNRLLQLITAGNFEKVDNNYYMSVSNFKNIKQLYFDLVEKGGKRFTKKREEQFRKTGVEGMEKFLYPLYKSTVYGHFVSPRSGTSYFVWPKQSAKYAILQNRIYIKNQITPFNKGHIVEYFLSQYKKSSNYSPKNPYTFAQEVGKNKDNIPFIKGGDYSMNKIAIQVKLSNNKKIMSYNQLRTTIDKLYNIFNNLDKEIDIEKLRKALLNVFGGYISELNGDMEQHLTTELLEAFISVNGKTVCL